MEISNNFFKVYDCFKKHFSDIISDQYVARGEDWERFNFKKNEVSGSLCIFFKETQDNKISLRFGSDIANFLPTFITMKDHQEHRGFSVKINADTDSESFFVLFRSAFEKLATSQKANEEESLEIRK